MGCGNVWVVALCGCVVMCGLWLCVGCGSVWACGNVWVVALCGRVVMCGLMGNVWVTGSVVGRVVMCGFHRQALWCGVCVMCGCVVMCWVCVLCVCACV